MYCESCGTAIGTDTRYCPHCGHAQPGTPSGGDHERGAAGVGSTARGRSPWIILLVVLVIAIVVGGGILLMANRRAAEAAADTAARAAAANEAIQAVGLLDSALGVGINFSDYSSKLGDAAAAVDSYEPEDSTGEEIKTSLAKAILYYKAGHDAWNADIQGKMLYKRSPAYWLADYPELPLSSGDTFLTADEIRQAAWSVGGQAYSEAKTSAAAYSK